MSNFLEHLENVSVSSVLAFAASFARDPGFTSGITKGLLEPEEISSSILKRQVGRELVKVQGGKER